MRTKLGFFKSPHIISLRPTFESECVKLRDLRRRCDEDMPIGSVPLLLLLGGVLTGCGVPPVLEFDEEFVESPSSLVCVLKLLPSETS